MIESSAATIAKRFAEFLAKVELGETVRIFDNGRAVARIVPDGDFIPGRKAGEFFQGMTPDPSTADAIALELQKLEAEAENALDH